MRLDSYLGPKVWECFITNLDGLEQQSIQNKGKDIKNITLEYLFDYESARDAITKEFYNTFKKQYSNGERESDLCDFLNKNFDNFISDNYDDILKFVKTNSEQKNIKYLKFVENIFNDEDNFKIFKSIRTKHFFDINRYKSILVKYDGKDIQHASFGQKCTAVIVIMILFGNYPLIIDEPESHLDSSLIANYLVPLIQNKKNDRQIIFATHNANFVINGDAEKIFILKNDSGVTEIIETTIENVENRPDLLKLEGGKEAFEKRGEKLNINKLK